MNLTVVVCFCNVLKQWCGTPVKTYQCIVMSVSFTSDWPVFMHWATVHLPLPYMYTLPFSPSSLYPPSKVWTNCIFSLLPCIIIITMSRGQALNGAVGWWCMLKLSFPSLDLMREIWKELRLKEATEDMKDKMASKPFLCKLTWRCNINNYQAWTCEPKWVTIL